MLEINPKDLIELCKKANKFYKEGIILYVENNNKIYNISDTSFENLKIKIYGV